MVKRKPNYFFIIIFSILLAVMLVDLFSDSFSNVDTLNYNTFLEYVEDGEISTITIQEKSGIYEITGDYLKDNQKTRYETIAPNESFTLEQVNDAMDVSKAKTNKEVQYKVLKASNGGFLAGFLNLFLMIGLPLLMMYFIFRMLSKQNGKAMNFGVSKAKRVENPKTKFTDVAGYVEEKQELSEVVDFLKTPAMFEKMGARIPKGILLVGPPGTGKTLLAKSIAGEASVPFYSISGSDFVEMFVGVGASRVRDLFKEAKKNAPSIVFIDEIDAVGRKRGNGIGGGNDEREQTLNQMLVEMDGFEPNSGVIIMAATNRDDVLDPALLRPGRFDRHIRVDLPDLATRKEILSLHKGKRNFLKSVNLDEYALLTTGFSGADLENMVNEAALVAVRHNKKAIDDSDVEEAIDRVVAGTAKKTRKYSKSEKKMVAYHETGHVVIGLELDDVDQVQKVTIVPRGQAGGYAMMAPKEESFFTSKSNMLHRITGLLAGRASEELFIKEITSGAHNDLERATRIARAMVTQFGMTDLSLTQLELREDLENPYAPKRYSDDVAKQIDLEVKKILDQCMKDCKAILKRRKKDVDLIAKTLQTEETLSKEQIDYLLKNKKLPKVKKVAETYTDSEIEKHEKDAIRKRLKQIQNRQLYQQSKDPEVKVMSDKDLEILVDSTYNTSQSNSMQKKIQPKKTTSDKKTTTKKTTAKKTVSKKKTTTKKPVAKKKTTTKKTNTKKSSKK
ncbi:MAG: ATP-dependent zinc metalloprotease FtsH [Mycoplasmatales bacterium]